MQEVFITIHGLIDTITKQQYQTIDICPPITPTTVAALTASSAVDETIDLSTPTFETLALCMPLPQLIDLCSPEIQWNNRHESLLC